jgi:phage FluMu protein Com
MKNVIINDYRCEHCKKLFFKGTILSATIEIKCKSCKNISIIKGENCLLWSLSTDDGNLTAICKKCEHQEKCDKYQMVHEKKQCPMCQGALK